jgi:ATP-dependent metalloprotease
MIDVALGGRAAEEIFMGKDLISSGCSNDLAKATELAYMYIKQLGMDESVSLISSGNGKIKTSEKYDYMVDMQVKKLLDVKKNLNL